MQRSSAGSRLCEALIGTTRSAVVLPFNITITRGLIMLARQDKKPSFNFLYSVPPGTEKDLKWGAQHYSLRVACDRFLSMFEANGLNGQPVVQPHIYDHPTSMSRLSPHLAKPMHLTFRPFDLIRVLKPAYNVGCIVWEFDHLMGEQKGQHPFANQVRMLSCLDEIWTPSSFAKSVFQQAGCRKVYQIPIPIAMPEVDPTEKKDRLERLFFVDSVTLSVSHFRSNEQNTEISKKSVRPLYSQPALANLKDKKVFVAVLNPGDYRKNLEAMLKGFAALYQADERNVLILKCVVDNVSARIDNVQNDIIKPKLQNMASLASRGIVLITAALPEEDMAELYRIADFYLSTARCEGQNLPLIEAMSHGVIPLSVDNTAMYDYINDENSFVIPSRREPVLEQHATAHWQPGLTWFEASAQDLLRTAVRATQAGADEIRAKRIAARRTVEAQFGHDAVYKKVSERFAALGRSGQISLKTEPG